MPKNDSSIVFVTTPPLSGGVKGSDPPSNSMASATDASFCVSLNGRRLHREGEAALLQRGIERVAQLGRRVVDAAAPRLARPPCLFVALSLGGRAAARRGITAARRHAQPRPLRAHLDAMEPAVARRASAGNSRARSTGCSRRRCARRPIRACSGSPRRIRLFPRRACAGCLCDSLMSFRRPCCAFCDPNTPVATLGAPDPASSMNSVVRPMRPARIEGEEVDVRSCRRGDRVANGARRRRSACACCRARSSAIPGPR